MSSERYARIFKEFDVLLRYGLDVLNLLDGREVKMHMSYACMIYAKLLHHSVSLQKLSPKIDESDELQLWDLSSLCAIARCIIEAHDVLGYMVDNKISDQEREFRMLLWELHDLQRRSKMLRSINSKKVEANEIHDSSLSLKEEAIAHYWYENISKEMKRKIEKGDASSTILSQKELNFANGVNHEYHNSATMWLSQYVHTFPMSLHQLAVFTAGTSDAFNLMSAPIQYVMGYVAKSIVRMLEIFPDENVVISAEDNEIFSNWCAIIENGVDVSKVV